MEDNDDDRIGDYSDWSDDEVHLGAAFELEDLMEMEGNADLYTTQASASGPSESAEQTFDLTLPMQHSYLGTDLTVLHGRTLLDDEEGTSHWMPLLPQIDVVLFPGQTLPLSVFHQPTIQMINRVLEGNRIFGTVCILRSDTRTELTYADVGTTAEIYEVQERGGDNLSMRIKAIGRQRFKLIETKQDSEGFTTARVKILPEITLPNPISEISLMKKSSQCVRKKSEAESSMDRHKLCAVDSAISVWPSWVFEQYNPERLVQKMLSVLSSHILVSQIPTDPVELSFWVARSLPMKDATRLIPLRMNSAIQRLRWEIYTLEKRRVLCCRHCNQTIADQQDVFSMSAEGMQATYCNVYGYVYETITIHKAHGLRLQNAAPSTEYSWFPGYAWTVAACSSCRKHVGWLFTATESQTKPRLFWGLCRRSLTAKLKKEK